MRIHYTILVLLIKFYPKAFRRFFSEYREAYETYWINNDKI
jgi:hypothetical protein